MMPRTEIPGVRRSIALIVVAWVCMMANPASAKTKANTPAVDCGDDVADQQGMTTFSSLLDGQPTDPQRPTLAMGLSRTSETAQLQTAIQFAPGKERGACDAVLSVILPTVSWDSKVRIGKSVGIGWEQRWHADDGRIPTIATFVSSVVDYSRPKPGVTLNGTLIVAKTVGEVAVYGNAFIEYTKVPGNAAIWTPGFIIGIKARARAEDAFVVDLVVEKDAPASLEFGYQLAAPDKFDIGPGFAVLLENHPHVTLGIVIQREF